MKKIILIVGVVGVFVVYSLVLRTQHTKTGGVTTTSALTTATGSATSGSKTSTGSSGTSTSTATYKDGTYDGDTENAFYGNVQVAVTVSGGKITTVTFLQQPDDSANSQDINGQAVPLLKQEAIKAQNAHVNVVSGATQTSDAFAQSLASALQKAEA